MTWFPFGNLTHIGLIWWYEVKWVKEEPMWSVVSLLRTKRIKKFVTNVCCHVRGNNRDLIWNITTRYYKIANNVCLILLISKINLLRLYFWLWSLMILLIIIRIFILIFKLELRWEVMLSIACINSMSCLSTMTANFRSISSLP